MMKREKLAIDGFSVSWVRMEDVSPFEGKGYSTKRTLRFDPRRAELPTLFQW